MRAHVALLLASSLAACAVDGDDDTQGGNGKADGNGSCSVPEYGDGTCHIDIACDVPDIDCYMTFETDDAAAAWLQTQLPHFRIAAPDPRAIHARAIVDRAFELFKSRVQLGSLADKRLSVVVLEGPANAFILDDLPSHKGGWSVQIESGLLDGHLTDDQILGVMAHELTHLAKLHFIQEVDDRMRKFYIAPDGKEPIGEVTPEHAIAKQHGEQWRNSAVLAGPYTNPELGDIPLGGSLGTVFTAFIEDHLYTSCYAQASSFVSQYNTVARSISLLDSSLTINATTAPLLKSAFDALLQCGAAQPQTLRAYLDALSPEWVPSLQPKMSADELALLDKPILSSLVSIVRGRRAQMRAAQEAFVRETGRPWTALRFYSYEEQADDSSVRILKSANIDAPAGVKVEFLAALAEAAPACEQALSAGTAPYGVNYSDEHHGTCWRIAHAAQVAAPASTARLLETDDEPRVAREPRHAPRRPGANPIY